MADAVQIALDRCVEALEQLRERGLFSPSEVRKIVAKRREHEYRCRRRETAAADFVAYVEYERALDRLREARRKKLGLPPARSDSFGVKHIHALYGRACERFPADLELARAHIAFAAAGKSKKLLSRLYARVLQLHPLVPGLWVEAANREFFDEGNSTAARTLLQRGLRHNAESCHLWVQYFRLECLCLQKLVIRREKLGLTSVNGEALSDDINKKAVIPEIVYNSAVQAVPADVGLRVRILQCVCDDFATNDLPNRQGIVKLILDSLARDFPLDEVAWEARAIYALPPSSPEQAFRAACEARPTESMWLRFHAYVTSGEREGNKKVAAAAGESLLEEGLTALESADPHTEADQLRIKLASSLLQTGHEELKSKAKSLLQKGGTASCIFLSTILRRDGEDAEARDRLEAAAENRERDILLWAALVEVCKSRGDNQSRAVQLKSYGQALRVECLNGQETLQEDLALDYVRECWENFGSVEDARSAFDEVKVYLGSRIGPELWLVHAHYEQQMIRSTPRKKGPPANRVRSLFEDGLLRHPRSEELWHAYIGFEKSESGPQSGIVSVLKQREQIARAC